MTGGACSDRPDALIDALARCRSGYKPTLASMAAAIDAARWQLDRSERAVALAEKGYAFDAARLRAIIDLDAAKDAIDLFTLAEGEVRAVLRRAVRNRAIGQIEVRA